MSNDLFCLIKSMSGTEKRYFKINAAGKRGEGKGNYIMLFDAIDNQNNYNEQLLKKNNDKQFSKIKHRLYNHILKCLELYHTENSTGSLLQGYLKQIEVLFNKGLKEQCRKLIVKAKKIAHEGDYWEALLGILRWEALLINTKDVAQKGSGYQSEIHSTIEKIKNYYRCRELMQKAVLIHNSSTKLDRKKIEILNSILHEPLIADESKIMSLSARRMVYYTQAAVFMVKNNMKEAIRFSRKLMELPDPNTDTAGIAFSYVALRMHIAICLNLRLFSEAEEKIQEMRAIPERYNLVESNYLYPQIISSSFDFSLGIYIETGNFDNAVKFIDKNAALFLQFEKNNQVEIRMMHYFNIFRAYFGALDLKKAWNWLNKTIDLAREFELDTEMNSLCRILSIIVCYESGDFDSLQYVLRSTYRYLHKRKQLYQFERALMDLIRLKFPKTKTKKDQLNLFIELKKTWFRIDPIERDKLKYFDFSTWIESKIQNKLFADVLKDKLKANL